MSGVQATTEIAPAGVEPSPNILGRTVTVTVPPLGDVVLPAGRRWGEIVSEVATLLCWPEFAMHRVTVAGLALSADTVVGVAPLLPGAILQTTSPVLRNRLVLGRHRAAYRPRQMSRDVRLVRRWVTEATPTPALVPGEAAPTRSNWVTVGGPLISGLGSMAVAYAMRQPIFALFGLFALLAMLPSALAGSRSRAAGSTVRLGSRRDLRLIRRTVTAAGRLPQPVWQDITTAAAPSLTNAVPPPAGGERRNLQRAVSTVNFQAAYSPRQAARLATSLAARGATDVTGAASSYFPWLGWYHSAHPTDTSLPTDKSSPATSIQLTAAQPPGIPLISHLIPNPIPKPTRRPLAANTTEKLARDWAQLEWRNRSLAWPALAANRVAPASGAAGHGLPERVGVETLLRTNQPTQWSIPLGVSATGLVNFDLVKDGPHLLVAGTTGSGKSEVLRALILALAHNNSPTQLSLVLVDFKGGASFGNVARLPQVVGQVTDLEPGLASRVIVGLRAELRRRKQILAAHNASDIADLRADLLPRLVVVFDEFRALTEDVPDAVGQLLRIAAQGRALGVHLVLATQRAAGAVSAEVRANVSARLALRLVDASDSNDVLDSPIAASLPSIAGRAVLKLGANPAVLFQSAWADAPDSPGVSRPDSFAHSVAGHPLRVVSEVDQAPAALEALPSAALVSRIIGRYRGMPAGAPPWLPPLPARISRAELAQLADVPADVSTGILTGISAGILTVLSASVPVDIPAAATANTARPLRFALGDFPDRQLQQPIAWAGTAGPLGIIGGARSGRTTALLTLAAAALEVGWQVHLLGELPDDALWLARHPNFGTAVPLTDLARAGRLLRTLARRDAGTARVLLLVDQIDEWRAQFLSEGVDLLPLLPTASTGGGLVATASAANFGGLAAKLTSRLVLLSADRSEDLLLGAPATFAGMGRMPGRGVWLNAGEQTLVQVAVAEQPQRVLDAGTRSGGSYPSRSARRTRTVPARLAQLPDIVLASAVPEWAIGVGGADAEPCPLEAANGALVVGPRGSGRTNALLMLLRATVAGELACPANAPGLSDLADPTNGFANTIAIGLDPALHAGCAALGIKTATPTAANLATILANPPRLLMLDDLDIISNLIGANSLDGIGDLAQGGATTVFASSTTFAATVTTRGLIGQLRTGRTGIVLHPAERGSGEVFAAELLPPHDQPLPGRGWLVQDGKVQPIQIAQFQ